MIRGVAPHKARCLLKLPHLLNHNQYVALENQPQFHIDNRCDLNTPNYLNRQVRNPGQMSPSLLPYKGLSAPIFLEKKEKKFFGNSPKIFLVFTGCGTEDSLPLNSYKTKAM